MRADWWRGGRPRGVYRFIGFSSIKKENEFSLLYRSLGCARAAAAAATTTTTVFPTTKQLRGLLRG